MSGQFKGRLASGPCFPKESTVVYGPGGKSVRPHPIGDRLSLKPEQLVRSSTPLPAFDTDTVIRSARELLTAGCAVVSCIRAIEYAGAHRGTIDLVFSDVVLPDMSRKAMVEQLRQWHPESRVRVLTSPPDTPKAGPKISLLLPYLFTGFTPLRRLEPA
jgi:hypothetical protein